MALALAEPFVVAVLAVVVGAVMLGLAFVAGIRAIAGPPCPEPPHDDELYEAPTPPPGGGAAHLFLGPNTSCAAMRDDAMFCWGDLPIVSNEGSVPRRPHARRVSLPRAAQPGFRLFLAEHGYCALTTDGKLSCEPAGEAAPFPKATLDGVRALGLGQRGVCAIRDDGPRCWIGNEPGARRHDPPTLLVGAPPNLEAVTVGAERICVATREGRVACRDTDATGQPPFREIDIGGVAIRLVAGSHHACALTREGSVTCWSSKSGEEVPSPIALPARATDIDAAEARTCAVTEGGQIYCWGDIGACGIHCASRSLFAVPKPTVVRISDAVEVRLGRDHACARKRDGAVECWGDNSRHQVSAFVPFDDYGYTIDRCDTTHRIELPGTDFPIPVRW